jgi:hypothetical protein
LKDKLGALLKYIANEIFAKDGANSVYSALLQRCNKILEDTEPNEEVLAVLKVPFAADSFQPEEVLHHHPNLCVLPCRVDQFGSACGYSPALITGHKSILSAITERLSDVAELTETILASLNGLAQEDGN